jgi:hypothetical protein
MWFSAYQKRTCMYLEILRTLRLHATNIASRKRAVSDSQPSKTSGLAFKIAVNAGAVRQVRPFTL